MGVAERQESGLAGPALRTAGEILRAKKVFFLFSILSWRRSQALARDRHSRASSMGLHAPPHTPPSIPFPHYWLYTLHNLICATTQAPLHPSSQLFVRERDVEKRGPNADGRLGYHKSFLPQPRKGPQHPWSWPEA